MKYFFAASLILLTLSNFAQQGSPEFINYSSIIRGSDGQEVTGRTVSFRFTIRELQEEGEIAYQETQTTTTSQIGSVSLKIGSGEVQSGDFSAVDWGMGSHYLQIELDDDGGSDFSDVGTVMLVSVPYALHSKSSTFADSAAAYVENDPIFLESIAAGITEADTARWSRDTFDEMDPVFASSVAQAISGNDTAYWNSKSDFDGLYESLINRPNINDSIASYLEGNPIEISESDPIFSESAAISITSEDISNWNNISPPWTVDNDTLKYTKGEIHIGNRPAYADDGDGVLKINYEGNAGAGLLLRNYLSDKNSTIGIYNDTEANMILSFSGSSREDTWGNNAAKLLTSYTENATTQPAKMVLGHQKNSAPIIFANNGQEVARMENGDLEVGGIIESTTGGIKFPDGSIQTTATTNSPSPWEISNDTLLYTAGEVHIGNLPAFPTEGDGVLKINYTTSGGSAISMRNYDATKNTNISLWNDDRVRLFVGIAGTQRTLDNWGENAVKVLSDFQQNSGGRPSKFVLGNQNNSAPIIFADNGLEVARLQNGNMGLGGVEPSSKIQVKDGDVYLETIGTGVIMKSPNGNCWRFTIDDTGQFVSTSIPCPGE